MKKRDILKELQVKGNKGAVEAAQLAVENKYVLKQIFDGVSSFDKRVKNAAGKTLQIISNTAPECLYPEFDFFIELMDGDDTILRWIGIDIVGNVSHVDSENKINKRVLKRLYTFISDESMITAGHSIDSLGKIARSKSRYRKEITTELLKVEKIQRNEECRNIHIGQTILAFREYTQFVKNKNPMEAFARRALNNSRSATRKKADKFLSEFEKG